MRWTPKAIALAVAASGPGARIAAANPSFGPSTPEPQFPWIPVVFGGAALGGILLLLARDRRRLDAWRARDRLARRAAARAASAHDEASGRPPGGA